MPLWRHHDVISSNQCFLVFSSYFCAEGQHSQKLMIKNTWSIRQTINLDFSPSKSYECLVLQWNIGFRDMWTGRKGVGEVALVNANCSQLCVYFLNYFSRKGSKIYQINKNSQQKKIASKFVWRHRSRHRSTEKVWDNIFLKTIVFKATKILDPKHHNLI